MTRLTMNSQGGLPPRSAAFVPPPEPAKPKVPVWFYIGGGALFLCMFAALVVTSTLLFVQSREGALTQASAALPAQTETAAVVAEPDAANGAENDAETTRADVNLLDSDLRPEMPEPLAVAVAEEAPKPSTLDVLKALGPTAQLPSCIDYLDTMVKITQVRFPLGSNQPHASDLPRVRNIATALALCPDVKVVVEGHSDRRGNAKLNMDLSWYRAETVVQKLRDEGFDTASMEPLGFGARRPINLSGTTSGEGENRRVQFQLVPKDTDLDEILARN